MIAHVAVACADPRHLTVGAVQDDVLPTAVGCTDTLVVGDDWLAPVVLHFEVHCSHIFALHGPEPHQLSAIVEDHRAVLDGTFVGGIRFRGDEDVALGSVVRGRIHLYNRQSQVWPRAEGERGMWRRRRGGRPGTTSAGMSNQVAAWQPYQR